LQLNLPGFQNLAGLPLKLTKLFHARSLAILKSPWFKGIIGEFIVNLSTKLMLNKDEYHLIKNITLPTDDGTTQIDHIIVSIYGASVGRAMQDKLKRVATYI